MKELNLPFSLIPCLLNLTELNKLNAQQIISTRFLGTPVHESSVYILIQQYPKFEKYHSHLFKSKLTRNIIYTSDL